MLGSYTVDCAQYCLLTYGIHFHPLTLPSPISRIARAGVLKATFPDFPEVRVLELVYTVPMKCTLVNVSFGRRRPSKPLRRMQHCQQLDPISIHSSSASLVWSSCDVISGGSNGRSSFLTLNPRHKSGSLDYKIWWWPLDFSSSRLKPLCEHIISSIKTFSTPKHEFLFLAQNPKQYK